MNVGFRPLADLGLRSHAQSIRAGAHQAMWFVALIVQAIFVGYCLSSGSIPLSFPPFLRVEKKKSPHTYWLLIGWCCAGGVFILIMAILSVVRHR
jgi:hypothetical protein